MSNRKPYVREIQPTWWAKSNYYRLYMLREATVLPLILFTLFLVAGLVYLAVGEQAWQSWLNFMTNPLIVLVNIVALIASLFHAATFFKMMPQVMPIRIKNKEIEKKHIIAAQWSVVAFISVIIIAVI